jgi:hypothetical protein
MSKPISSSMICDVMMVLRHQVTLFPDITTKCTDHNNDEYFIYTDHYGYISSKTNTKQKQNKKAINKDGKKFEMAKTCTEPLLSS